MTNAWYLKNSTENPTNVIIRLIHFERQKQCPVTMFPMTNDKLPDAWYLKNSTENPTNVTKI
jgi:hypothetical protein